MGFCCAWEDARDSLVVFFIDGQAPKSEELRSESPQPIESDSVLSPTNTPVGGTQHHSGHDSWIMQGEDSSAQWRSVTYDQSELLHDVRGTKPWLRMETCLFASLTSSYPNQSLLNTNGLAYSRENLPTEREYGSFISLSYRWTSTSARRRI